ncbi:unnamed protein product [Gordionus sp. m RMFG-2023]
MIKAINGDVHGKVQKFLDVLLSPDRDSSNQVNAESALKAAQTLSSGSRISKLLGSKTDAYINILGRSNPEQLKLVFDQFQRLTKRSIEEDIKKNTVGKFQKSLLTMGIIISEYLNDLVKIKK